ncbi:MAG TPA: 1,4-alpha-glucan branching protein domain-containing protein [Solirubrobacteraceae bacterium]|nr:1,4-alpha-glucan branching protein domain-containing protein [Solirubrobacteraceae bacterium]
MAAQRAEPGELALVLHTHMPYVEGFGTWPFGEEWLWEAIATSYLPLLDVLAGPGGERVTLSITPVLADQLEVAGALGRCVEFLETIRPESHRLDIEELRADGDDALAAELERSAAEYATRARRLRQLTAGGGLLAALAPYASWTSSATHAILPLLATDAGALLQVQTGVASHRRRFGGWHGGLWLPECAHAPWLDELLEDAGVRATCVELTGVFGMGDPRHLRPLVATDGPVLWPLDRATIALVWGGDGYPSGASYRDSHRHTTHRHHVWRNDGAPYDHEAALAQARADAAEFVAHVRARVAGGGVCVCALDTELLGHWWYEGVAWLAAVLQEAARQGLALTRLDDAPARHDPAPAPEPLPVSTWGDGGDLRTWSGPQVAELAWPARSAELRLAAMAGRPPDRALRELLALQSSDWAFLHTRATAGDYPAQRAAGHGQALERAAARDPDLAAEPALRGLAPDLTGWS